MFVGYEDVKSRIDEEPTWYTREGFPRYGEYVPHECDVYAEYSVLREIQCQDCRKFILIGEDYNSYDLLQVLIDVDKLDDDVKPMIDENGELWLGLRESFYAPRARDAEGNRIYRTLTLEDVVKNWGMGDPPNHGCVGDTMGCIERRSVQVWDLRYGKVVENGIVKVWGEPKRIEELENFDYTPDWWLKMLDKES